MTTRCLPGGGMDMRHLNGNELGVVWCAPWQVDVTEAVTAKGNVLEIEVVKLWPNRLTGDQSLPEEKQFTRTTCSPYTKDSPLLPSGLLGPVNILSASVPGAEAD